MVIFQGHGLHSPSWPQGFVCEPNCTNQNAASFSSSTLKQRQDNQTFQTGAGKNKVLLVAELLEPQSSLTSPTTSLPRKWSWFDREGQNGEIWGQDPRGPNTMAISAPYHHLWISAFPAFRSAVNYVSSSLCKLVNSSSVVQRLLSDFYKQESTFNCIVPHSLLPYLGFIRTPVTNQQWWHLP